MINKHNQLLNDAKWSYSIAGNSKKAKACVVDNKGSHLTAFISLKDAKEICIAHNHLINVMYQQLQKESHKK